jgi:hypothetical protein
MAASASSRTDSAAEQLSRATLKLYADRPELDPRQDLTEFAQCRNTDDIMLALKKRINTLKDFREDCRAKTCKKLESIVQVLQWATDTAGKSAESIVCSSSCICASLRTHHFARKGIPGGKAVFAAVDLLLAVSTHNQQYHHSPIVIQATQAQSTRYDILEKLLERLDTVLSSLNVLCEKIFSKKKFSHPCLALDDIATTILAHLFYVLALSTKFLRKPRGRLFLPYK